MDDGRTDDGHPTILKAHISTICSGDVKLKALQALGYSMLLETNKRKHSDQLVTHGKVRIEQKTDNMHI